MGTNEIKDVRKTSAGSIGWQIAVKTCNRQTEYAARWSPNSATFALNSVRQQLDSTDAVTCIKVKINADNRWERPLCEMQVLEKIAQLAAATYGSKTKHPTLDEDTSGLPA
mmetsp:Transcript_63338/g.120801  ORF Transcript_63338/g.120801 Transcript_63338/m.120801 type:complete len:111 (-) Transcript_63338:85-417(-)